MDQGVLDAPGTAQVGLGGRAEAAVADGLGEVHRREALEAAAGLGARALEQGEQVGGGAAVAELGGAIAGGLAAITSTARPVAAASGRTTTVAEKVTSISDGSRPIARQAVWSSASLPRKPSPPGPPPAALKASA